MSSRRFYFAFAILFAILFFGIALVSTRSGFEPGYFSNNIAEIASQAMLDHGKDGCRHDDCRTTTTVTSTVSDPPKRTTTTVTATTTQTIISTSTLTSGSASGSPSRDSGSESPSSPSNSNQLASYLLPVLGAVASLVMGSALILRKSRVQAHWKRE